MVFGLKSINMTRYRFLFVISFMIMIESVVGQSKYGDDEQACKENVSVFKEYCKQKNYEDALIPWRWAYNNCPASYATIYKNGPKIIKSVIKSNPENKLMYIDTLMMIYDRRIKYGFGKQGYILGLKGYELFFIDKNRAQDAYDILDKSIKMEGNSSSVQAVYGYMKSIDYLCQNGVKLKEDVLLAYSVISSIIDYNIRNESKTTKNFIKYSEKIEDLFTPYANCDDLIKLFSEKYEVFENDSNFLIRVAKNLSDKECNKNELYIKILNKLNQIHPSYTSASELASAYFINQKFSDAIKLLENMLLENNNEENKYNLDTFEIAKSYLELANLYRMKKQYSKAISYTEKSLVLKPNFSEAYILQGNIYVSGANTCGNDFQNNAIYWIAVDCFKKALKDPNTKDLASKSINSYSKYFPAKETCFFHGVESGSTYLIECWVNRKTIARTID